MFVLAINSLRYLASAIRLVFEKSPRAQPIAQLVQLGSSHGQNLTSISESRRISLARHLEVIPGTLLEHLFASRQGPTHESNAGRSPSAMYTGSQRRYASE